MIKFHQITRELYQSDVLKTSDCIEYQLCITIVRSPCDYVTTIHLCVPSQVDQDSLAAALMHYYGLSMQYAPTTLLTDVMVTAGLSWPVWVHRGKNLLLEVARAGRFIHNNIQDYTDKLGVKNEPN